ncbi:MAG: hypothetical protein R2750_06960 [Bacteroidales bacterium]
MTTKTTLKKIRTLDDMEKDISNGFNPGCYLCGKELVIKEQDGKDGTKGFYYNCINHENCDLKDGFVKLSGISQIKQLARKKITILIIGLFSGGALMSITGLSDNIGTYINSSDKPENIDNKKQDEKINNLARLNEKLNDENLKLKEQLSIGTNPQGLNFDEKYNLALLYSGLKTKIDDKDVKHFGRAKNILFDLVDNHNDDPGNKLIVSETIAIALANLRFDDNISPNDIIPRIKKLNNISTPFKYLRQAEVYYTKGEKNDDYRIPSLYSYLKAASISMLPKQSYDEFLLQINYLNNNHKLKPIWEEDEVIELIEMVKTGNKSDISDFSDDLKEFVNPEEI